MCGHYTQAEPRVCTVTRPVSSVFLTTQTMSRRRSANRRLCSTSSDAKVTCPPRTSSASPPHDLDSSASTFTPRDLHLYDLQPRRREGQAGVVVLATDVAAALFEESEGELPFVLPPLGRITGRWLCVTPPPPAPAPRPLWESRVDDVRPSPLWVSLG